MTIYEQQRKGAWERLSENLSAMERLLRLANVWSTRYGRPLLVAENGGADPKLEQPETFLEVLYEALASRAMAGRAVVTI